MIIDNKLSIGKKWSLFLLVMFGTVVAIQLSSTQSVSAFNRSAYHGYFSNGVDYDGQKMQEPNGFNGDATDINSFVNWYRARVDSGGKDKTIASFTILTMLGKPVGSGRIGSGSQEFRDWEELVRSYNAAGRVHFNKMVHFEKNTYWQDNINDVAWYYESADKASVQFVSPNGGTYSIKRDCANPVGELSLLEPLDWELVPTSNVNKTEAKPGETVYFEHKVKNLGPSTATNFSTYRGEWLPDPGYTDNARNPTPQAALGSGDTRVIGGGTVPFRIPDSAENGDLYCQAQGVKPYRKGDDRPRRADRACVKVVVGKTQPGNPTFTIELDCRKGVTIRDLRNPSPRQNDNVAIRVKVYPNGQEPGRAVNESGIIQGDDNFVIRKNGTFTIPWPGGYGNISWRADARAYRYGTFNNPPTDTRGNPLPLNTYTTLDAGKTVAPCPSWQLTPSTNGGPGFVEQGSTINWNHHVTNSDPNGQGGMTVSVGRCVVYNYDIFNPNAGTGGEWCGSNTSNPLSPGGPWPQDNYGPSIVTNGSTPLGATYCQRYHLDKRSEFSNEGIDSGNACTKIVGGKTYLSVQPASAAKIEPGKLGTVTASTTTNSYADAPGYGGYGINCNYDVVSYLPYGGTQTKVSNANCAHQINSNGTRNVVNYSYRPTPDEVGSKICVSVRISATNGNGNLLAAGYPTSPPPSCFDVVTKPYMKVLGGDVSAGSCVGGNSVIAGWNKLSDQEGPTGNGNLGAGTRYATFAQGIINSFASGQDLLRDAGYGYSPTNLSFANTSTSTGGGNFGGYFSGTPCVLSYFGSKPSNPNEVSNWPGIGTASTTIGPKIYSLDSTSAPTVLGGATIPANVSIRLYVDGDVVLNDDIRANYTGAIDASQMPSFTLIVKGNIYVQPGVKELYGTYVSEGVGKGNIYTCSSGTNPINVANYSVAPPAALANPHTQCANQLTFTGAVVAQKVSLGRTYGSLYQDTGVATGQAFASEVFKYNPLSWIYSVVGPTTAHNDTYESMTTLPPVL